MGFLTNLRLAGITKGMTGTPYSDIPQGPDPLMEIINQYQNLLAQQPQIGNVANSMVAPSSTLEPPLRFGGVTGQSNPGADILARSAQSARETFEKMKAPQVTAGQVLAQSGIKPNEQFPTQTPEFEDKELNRRRTESIIRANDALAGNRGKENTEIINVTDPKDPSKQISIVRNKDTNEIKPLDISGIVTNKEKPADIEKRNNERQATVERDESLNTKSKDSLALLNQLLDPKTDKLTSEAEWATGGSAWTGSIPLPTAAYAGASKLEQLASKQVLDLIQEMKANSKTGATGMGNMSNRDLGVLQNASTLLSKRGLPEETIREQLLLVRDVLNRNISQTEPKLKSSSPVNTENLDTSGLNPPPIPPGYNPDKFEAVRRRDNKGWTFERKVGK